MLLPAAGTCRLPDGIAERHRSRERPDGLFPGLRDFLHD
ncbi:MAG: hypothetical protein FAZ92_02889 [Accumulibacter sp.]|nr:MAG: hypothetical protein FAZ92_02889 [Accumulibacter sp.]